MGFIIHKLVNKKWRLSMENETGVTSLGIFDTERDAVEGMKIVLNPVEHHYDSGGNEIIMKRKI